MHPLKNFYTPLRGAPEKCFKSGPALANASPGYSSFKTVICVKEMVNKAFIFWCDVKIKGRLKAVKVTAAPFFENLHVVSK